MRNFKQLKVWQKGFDIAVQTIDFAATLPASEKFGLSSQLTRSAVSIPSNVAEGSSRSSNKDYCRFMEIALGSAFELETQILITQRAKLGNQALANTILKDIDEEQKMLMSFMNKLQ
ncbi:MAG: four helix bundle protein [Bacteroidota bacterium]|nr:four helix bundle protein [Bacteroidota bacterium]